MAGIFHTERGTGDSVILLHGFPFHHRIWDGFASRLAENFNVYTPDLPGFGKSDAIKAPFSIERVADRLVEWIEDKKISNIVVIGHSLGGYVAMSVAESKPDLIGGLGLFHSTAYADTAEKKESRNKVLEFVNNNGVEAFTSNFISPLFADAKHPAIPMVREIAMQASTLAVVGYTLAMRDRVDKVSMLNSFPKPILFIAGEKDPGISVASIREQSACCKDPQVEVLPQVAHMGMFENEKSVLKIITGFANRCSVTQ